MIDLENKYLKRLMSIFEDSFINEDNEFIALLRFYPSDNLSYFELLEERTKGEKAVFVNEYFRLEDCENELDLKREILAWLSRACCKTQYSEKYDKYIHKYFRDRCNEFLQTNFSEDDWELIYCRLGNAINDKLCVEFINSNYDLSLLKDRSE